MDLSALKPTPPPPPGASWVVEADDQSFEQVLGLSMQHPLVLEFWSSRAPDPQFAGVLTDLANEAAGAYLLVRVDVDRAPTIAQALQIQSVPLVVGVIAGQLAPLFQGTTDKATAKTAIDQLLQVAASNGLSGRAQPVVDPTADAGGPDPRFDAADAALQQGDFAQAVVEFDKLLAANPADAEAAAGKAQASLMVRIADLDAAETKAKADADAADVDAQLAMADLEIATGRVVPAFDRIIEAIRLTSGKERDRARKRLLELFETVGANEPAVLKARRDLTTALF
ncbi:tetratricopeptide repeat protein [Propioniciclava coleopterorum]|uniref:Tetratricopeptide repeat protein n=1 Tax=Propioniciclava coleopterorum TaxID=2714937 RepID=A0A6G7YAI4_9ACTN|nr:tetratricopeptide repeat protein [Propioniciclava coleopterorum]QIK73648.1 tetratricopeptide repeat protein [Propioniciclava coleopterorum]